MPIRTVSFDIDMLDQDDLHALRGIIMRSGKVGGVRQPSFGNALAQATIVERELEDRYPTTETEYALEVRTAEKILGIRHMTMHEMIKAYHQDPDGDVNAIINDAHSRVRIVGERERPRRNLGVAEQERQRPPAASTRVGPCAHSATSIHPDRRPPAS